MTFSSVISAETVECMMSVMCIMSSLGSGDLYCCSSIIYQMQKLCIHCLLSVKYHHLAQATCTIVVVSYIRWRSHVYNVCFMYTVRY